MSSARTAQQPGPGSGQGRSSAHPGLFLLAAAVALLGLIGTYLYFVRTTTGQFIDESAWLEAPVVQRRIGDPISHFLDALPMISVLTGSVLVLLITICRRRWLAGVVAVAMALGANLSTQLLKASLPERPDRGIQTLDLNSLPSGHSALAASAVIAVFLVSSARWRPLVAFIGGSYAIASGVSTLINQWHRPADVVAAYLLVAAWTALGGWLLLRFDTAHRPEPRLARHWASSGFWPSLAAVLGIGAALVAAAALWPLRSGEAQESTVNYFLAGVSLIVTTGYLLCVAGILLFSSQSRRS